MKRLTLVLAAALPLAALAAPASKPATKPAAKPAAAKRAPAAPAKAPAAPAAPVGWKAFVAKDAGFTALFPGEPQREYEEKPGAVLAGYLLDRDGAASSVAVFMVSAGEEGQAVADSIFALLTDEEGSRVAREYEATVDGKPARGFDVETPDSAVTVRRLAAHGRYYVLILRVPRGSAVPEAEVTAFFGSFRTVAELEAPAAAAAKAEPAVPAKAGPAAPLPAAKATTGFKEFEAKDSGFAIAFPGEPEREASADGAFTGYRLKAAGGGPSFMALTVTATGDDVAAQLDRQIAGFVEAFGPSIQRDEPVTIAGLTGRSVSAAQGDDRIEVRFVVAKNRLHALIVGAGGATPSEADQKAFFGSFRTLP
jgi:hypothetical protein